MEKRKKEKGRWDCYVGENCGLVEKRFKQRLEGTEEIS